MTRDEVPSGLYLEGPPLNKVTQVVLPTPWRKGTTSCLEQRDTGSKNTRDFERIITTRGVVGVPSGRRRGQGPVRVPFSLHS